MFRFPDYGFLTGDLKKSASFVCVYVCVCVCVVLFFFWGGGEYMSSFKLGSATSTSQL